MTASTQQLARERMLAEHNTGIGGSQVASVFNLPPYGCARSLVMQKRGVPPDHPFHGNNATERGTRLEDFAAELYAEQTGRQIRRVPGALTGAARRDKEYPFILCRSDREIVNDARGPGVLSIKVVAREMFQKIKFEGLSHDYILQLQEELGVWDRTWGSYAIFWADGWELLWFDEERDDAIVSEIYEGMKRIWAVIQDPEAPLPERLDAKDRRCARCPYRTTCQGQAMVALMEKGKFTGKYEDDGLVIPFDAGLAELVQRRMEYEDVADQATALVEEANTRIKEYMGDSQALDTDGFRVYYRVQKGRKTLQADKFTKAFTQLHPEQAVDFAELAIQYTNQGAPFRSLRVYAR